MADDELATTQEQELRRNLHIIQSMIDLSAQLLEGLRTKCATNSELTQQEIRTLEGKLIKLFSNQLITKLKLNSISSTNNGCTTTAPAPGTAPAANGSGGQPPPSLAPQEEPIPSLAQWLQVVGLGRNSIQGVCQKISSVEELQEKSEHELRTILTEWGARPEELSRLCRALHNLKRYTDVLKRADNNDNSTTTTSTTSSAASPATAAATDTMHLYWDSWDRHHHLGSSGGTGGSGERAGAGLSPRTNRTRATRASVPSEDSLSSTATGANNNNGSSYHHHHHHHHHHQRSATAANNISSSSGGGSGGHVTPSPSVSSINSLNATHYFSSTSAPTTATTTTNNPVPSQNNSVSSSTSSHLLFFNNQSCSMLSPSGSFSPSSSSSSGVVPATAAVPPPPSAVVMAPSLANAAGAVQPQPLMLPPPLTPPPPPPQQNRGKGMKFPTTPPPRRKHQTSTTNSGMSSSMMGNNNSSGVIHTPALLPDSYPLTKSKSHESQLANKSGGGAVPSNGAASETNTCADISSCGIGVGGAETNMAPATTGGVATVPRRTRFPTEPGPDLMTMSLMDYGSGIAGTQTANSSPSSMLLNSPIKSPPYYYYNNAGTDSDDNSYKSATSLQVPKSPRTPVLPNVGGASTTISNSTTNSQQQQQQQVIVSTTTSTTTAAPPVGVVRNMTHQIKHRFTKSFKMMSHCGYCQKPIYFGTGYKCKECKYTCHRECEDKVAPSCGLPAELLNEFKKKLSGEGQQVFPSPNMVRAASNNPTRNLVNSFSKHHRKKSNPQPSINIPLYQPPDSGSNTSSCNSSTPSSPALQNIPTPHSSHKQQFNFPDVPPTEPTSGGSTHGEITIETHPLNIFHHHQQQSHHYDHHSVSNTPHHHYQQQYQPSSQQQVQSQSQQTMTQSQQANHQNQMQNHQQNQVVGQQQHQQQQQYQHQEIERTSSSVSGSTDSDKTPVRVDSLDSQVSDTETVSGGEGGRQWSIRQNSLSMREWDIPYEELKMNEPIGTGRFGTVYRGYWHGDVAVKVLDMHYLQDEKTLEQFKIEVSIFRKTRHENLILFMGACMQPPKLAIVTSLSKGMTLYTHIHLRKDKFNMNKTTIVAQQISQGMGYLHARGIVHKDLKSKNIFLENGKVVITDFGLFSVTKLCFGNKKNDSLGIPPGWLCYLSPEIIRSLHAHQSHDNELPFSQASDVYAFGTVWYELLCGEWPFKSQPPEAIIWQVGKGMKQPLANLQASRDVKDILMLCWSFNPDNRPDFIRLLRILNKLPKKRLARSPSHPIHLSRSAESVF